ncbi:MAG: hypothetical protein LH606_14155 [Cytophagaceae bacterium]|nr:hypothetical protein [Cytophagaceae bacterium]
MKSHSICLVAALFLIACADSGQETTRKLSGEVLAIHDEVMPKSEEIINLKRELQDRMGKDSTARPMGDSLVVALDRADNAMSDWMAGFDVNAAKNTSSDQAAKYFGAEKEKIAAIKKQTDESIIRAREFLKTTSQK